MKIFVRSSLALFAALAMTLSVNDADATTWYATNEGTGTGLTVNSPCSLENIMNRFFSTGVQPGDTVYLRDGNYSPATSFGDGNVTRVGWYVTIAGTPANKILIAAYPGEMASIDRCWMFKSGGYGHDICFSNLEFYNSNKGHELENTSGNGNPPAGSLPWVHFAMDTVNGCQWFNCLVHDVHNAWGGSEYLDAVKGCAIWHVGWDSLEHVLYTAPSNFTGNICAWCDWNIFNFVQHDVVCQNNIICCGGDTEPTSSGPNQDLFDVSCNALIQSNWIYDRYSRTQSQDTYGLVPGYGGETAVLTIVGNLIATAKPFYWSSGQSSYGSTILTNNTIYTTSANGNYVQDMAGGVSVSGTIDYNSYYSVGSVSFKSGWPSEAHSTSHSSSVPPDAYCVFTNPCGTKSLIVGIANWSKASTKTVDLSAYSSCIKSGDQYVVYCGYNPLTRALRNTPSTVVVSGTFNGSITFPMTGLLAAPILYGNNVNNYDSGNLSLVNPSIPSPAEFAPFTVVVTTGSPVNPTAPATNPRVMSINPAP